jgi:hypothetical protein
MIWIYHDTTADRYIAFSSGDDADAWIVANDPEGVAFGYEDYEIVPMGRGPEGWQSVLKGGQALWHGPLDACARFVADPAFREECLRSKQLKPG